MHRARNSKGRFVKRRRKVSRRHNPSHGRRRRRARLAVTSHRRRRNPSMRRRTARRRVHRRRRHNPGLLKGLTLPNFENVAVGVAGGVGSKIAGRMLFPQGATMFGGWGGPLTTLGMGVALGFLLPMVGMRRFAPSVVAGAATIAAYDAIKLTPLAPQLGVYTAPAGMVPVLNGVGAATSGYPDGFHNPSLGYADDNNPTGFEWAP